MRTPLGMIPGLGQNTIAAQMLFAQGTRTGRPTRRKRSPTRPRRVRAKTSTRRPAATKRRAPMRLKKGSMAAKRYMAKIRKMRRRR